MIDRSNEINTVPEDPASEKIKLRDSLAANIAALKQVIDLQVPDTSDKK